MIEIEANNPPGKHCTLYIGYAQKIGQQLGVPFSVIFHPSATEQGRITPTMRIGGITLTPSNSETLSPGDICAALGNDRAGLLTDLTEVQQAMQAPQ